MAHEGFTRALIVGNVSAVLAQLQEALQKAALPVVHTAPTVQEAMDKLESTKPHYNIIFIHIQLAEVPSAVLLQFIRSHPVKIIRETTLVAIMSNPTKEDYLLLNETGVLDFITFPFSTPDVLKKITEIFTEEFDKTSERNFDANFKEALLTKNLKAAETLLLPCLKQEPRSVKYLTAYATLLFKMNKIKKCEEFLNKVLAIDSKYIPALNLMYKVYFKLRKYDECLQVLEETNELNSQNIDRLLVMGELYLAGEKSESAELKFRSALKLNPKDRRAVYGLGRALTTLGKIEESKTLFQHLNKNPEMASFFNSKGILLVRAKKYDEGISLYLNAIKALDDKDQEYLLLYNISLAYLRSGDYDTALEYAQKSSESAPPFYKRSSHLYEKLKKEHGVIPEQPIPMAASAESSSVEVESETISVDKYLLTSSQEEFILNGFGAELESSEAFPFDKSVEMQEDTEIFGVE